MLALSRFIIALFALLFGWNIFLLSINAVVYYGWYFMVSILTYFDFYYLSYPANSFIDWLIAIQPLALWMMGTHVVISLLMPKQFIINSVSEMPKRRLNKKHPISLMVQEIAIKMHIRTPKVYLLSQQNMNAFALSSLFNSSVTFTIPLIEKLDPESLKWVISHELSHIRNNDSWSSTFWMSSMYVLSLTFKLKFYIDKTIIYLMSLFFGRFFRHIYKLFFVPLSLLSWLIRYLFVLTHRFFLYLDCSMVRLIELRCDRDAANYTSSDAGVRALMQLGDNWESTRFDLFATHPDRFERVYQLEQMNLDSYIKAQDHA
jgi:Zn-dependent protease with chaperone function